MTYWLYITNSQNWRVTERTNILGAAQRYKQSVQRMKIGDRVIVYMMGEKLDQQAVPPKIVGEFKVASELFEDNHKIFKPPTNRPDETYSIRRELKPVVILETPIDFHNLLTRLSFTKGKSLWSLALKGKAVMNLSEQDYDAITSLFSKPLKTSAT